MRLAALATFFAVLFLAACTHTVPSDYDKDLEQIGNQLDDIEDTNQMVEDDQLDSNLDAELEIVTDEDLDALLAELESLESFTSEMDMEFDVV
jgi:hypothetical protein